MTNPRGWWGSCPSSPPPVPRRAGQGQSPVAEANVTLGKVHFSGSMPRTRDHRALGPILPVPTSLPPSFTRGLGGHAVRPAPFPTLLGPPRESTNGPSCLPSSHLSPGSSLCSPTGTFLSRLALPSAPPLLALSPPKPLCPP